MSQFIIVPVHLDALRLQNNQMVTGPVADFSFLPYFNNNPDNYGDIHADIPYISEAVIDHPFNNRTQILDPGIHLHWALPDALTRITTGANAAIPAVPNRWMITRYGDGIALQQWVVESDYLYPNGTKGVRAVTYPVEADYGEAPFRYLGRRMTLNDWHPPDSGGYLAHLTAVGYGEPSFAAIYSNCHSVFGLHDSDYTGELPDNLSYDVLGWFSDAQNDPLTADPIQSENIKAALEARFGWTVATITTAPDRMLCYGRIDFPADTEHESTVSEDMEAAVVIGNNAIEAMSAHLATVILPGATDTDKAHFEEQIQAAMLSSVLNEQLSLDIDARFDAARHQAQFSSTQWGTLWNVHLIHRETAASSQADTVVSLPPDIADALNDVNVLQAAYNQATARIIDQRENLFADWYKYMLSAYPPDGAWNDYPDVDALKAFIMSDVIAPLQELEANTGFLDPDKNNAGEFVAHGDANSLAIHLATGLNNLNAMLETFTQQLQAQYPNSDSAYVLQAAPAPRYWQGNDPTVLLVGEAARPSPRHGQDGSLHPEGLLTCETLSATAPADYAGQGWATLRQQVAAYYTGDNVTADGFPVNTWEPDTWHPILLEWLAEFFPLQDGSNIDSPSRHYATDYITRHYGLPETAPDLNPVSNGQPVTVRDANIYAGQTPLTPIAGNRLQQELGQFLSTTKLPHDNPVIQNLQAAYDHLADNDAQDLAQVLGGFGMALRMRRQTLQLPIDEPLGFPEYQDFSRNVVAPLVQNSNTTAPAPLSDFNPIRAGAFRLNALEIIDNFGRIFRPNIQTINAPQPMKIPGDNVRVMLPPRITQLARLNFRWLSAESDVQEMNTHPLSSPICGWLLPNHLSGTIAVYNADGTVIGDIIDGQATLRVAPGHSDTTIANPHLNRVVQEILANIQNSTDPFFSVFMRTIDRAQTMINPAADIHDRSLALLIGQPIAVVRARLDLQVMGNPAVDQSWDVLRQRLQGASDDFTNAFTAVQFPVRIGEYQRSNDGLIGYWQENNDGTFKNDMFYSPQGGVPADERDTLPQSTQITTYEDEPLNLSQEVNQDAQYLTLLIDPRAPIHATCGILPVKAITIPPAHYSDAMQRLNVYFLTAPILTGSNTIEINLPPEASYSWSWLEQLAPDGSNPDNWHEVSSIGVVRQTVFDRVFDDSGTTLWQTLLNAGWLLSIDDTRAQVVALDERPALDEGDAGLIEANQPQIDFILLQSYISPLQSNARFDRPQRLRDGWLKLSHDNYTRPPASDSEGSES